MNDRTEDDELVSAIESTRADGHAIEDSLKSGQRTVSLSGKRLHGAIARAAEYQSAEITRNRGLLEELDVRAAYYRKLLADIQNVIAENARQRRVVAAALRGAIAGNAALEADMLRGPDE